jgi:hypothetical protein
MPISLSAKTARHQSLKWSFLDTSTQLLFPFPSMHRNNLLLRFLHIVHGMASNKRSPSYDDD